MNFLIMRPGAFDKVYGNGAFNSLASGRGIFRGHEIGQWNDVITFSEGSRHRFYDRKTGDIVYINDPGWAMTSTWVKLFGGKKAQGGGNMPFIGAKLGTLFGADRTIGKHGGVDYKGNGGEKIYSLSSGKIVRVTHYDSEDQDHGGVRVRILDNKGYATMYCHLQDGSTNHLFNNQNIRAGDYIGNVGNTGRVIPNTYFHLHLEVWQNNLQTNKIDPLLYYPLLNR
jgi:murein DD-endopeptidase MepM/ murein hydrolase activator NlpD